MSRPSRMMQSPEDQLANLPSQRWRWLFTPDPRWLNVVNTTALRTVNATRMFIMVTLLYIATEIGTVSYALTRCGILLKLGNFTLFQLTPPPGRLDMAGWRACEESIATQRILDFAAAQSSTYSLLLAAMAGIALGAMGIKRATDTEHKVAVEQAKKAPIIMPPVTGEHAAQQPPAVQTVNLNVTPPVEGTVTEEPKP